MKNEKALIVGGVVGLVAVIAAIAYEKKASASTTSTTPTSGGNTITLAPGPMNITVAQGVTITAMLPDVATSATNGQVLSSTQGTVSPGYVQIQPTTSGFATIVWNTPAGAQQTTTLNYTVVNESGQTV